MTNRKKAENGEKLRRSSCGKTQADEEACC
jgi:hypothetical protein